MGNGFIESGFSYFLSHTDDFIAVLSREGTILAISRMASLLCGYQEKVVEKINYFTLLAKKGIESPVTLSDLVKTRVKCKSIEQSVELNNQKYIILWTTDSFLDKKIKYYILWGKDITAQRLAEISNKEKLDFLEKLNRQVIGKSAKHYKTLEEHATSIHHHLESIIASMPGNVWWGDTESSSLGCNDNVAKMLGLKSRADIIGLDYAAQGKLGGWSEGQHESFRRDDLEVIKTGKPKLNVEEPPIKGIDGNSVYFLTNRVPLKDEEGRVTGVIGISIDITEYRKNKLEIEKLKDELLNANNEKKVFMFIAAMKTRIYLSAIETAYQILTQSHLPKKCTEVLPLIASSSQKILRVFDHIVDFLDLAEEPDTPLNIKTLAEEVIKTNHSLIDKKSTMVFVDYDRSIPDIIFSEIEKLFRVLNNLVVNALSNSEGTLIGVEIEKIKQTKDLITLKIVIFDNGIGISKEQLNGLFTIFQRMTINDPYQSGGLILSLTKKMVDALGGTIEVESENGKGVRFSLVFDFKLSEKNYSNSPEKTVVPINALILSNQPWFYTILAKYIPFNQPKLLVPMTRFIGKEFGSIDEYSLAFIESTLPLEVISQFAEFIQLEKKEAPFLIVAVGNAPVSEWVPLFGLKTVVINLSVPLTPRQFQETFVHDYQKWMSGDWAKIRTAVHAPKPRVLLVEDNKLAAQGMIALFNHLDCDIVHVSSAEDAINLINRNEQQQFDILFIDLGLPGISGLELAKYIRKHSIYHAIPIVAETAFTSADDSTRCIEAGMNAVLNKPIKLEAVQNLLRQFVYNQKSYGLLENE